MSFWAVIPAGGSGTRLWPLSRPASPKFLHDLTGEGRTLLQQTYDRLAPLTGDRILLITGVEHAEAVADQLPEVEATAILAEPSPRDSMAAIGLAAAVLEREGEEAVMGSFAADHVIGDPEVFRAAVEQAVGIARDGWLVTIGIEPDEPSTAYGYIRLGDALPHREGVRGAFRVREFVEKPDASTAAKYVKNGYRWNAGMFVAKPGVILELLAEYDPEFVAKLRAIAADFDLLEDIWPTLPRIAIDLAVAEPAAAQGRVAVVPGSFDWHDIGDFATLAALHGRRTSEQVRLVNSSGLVIPDGSRRITVLGLDNVVVVETGDELLITTTAQAQRVRDVAN